MDKIGRRRLTLIGGLIPFVAGAVTLALPPKALSAQPTDAGGQQSAPVKVKSITVTAAPLPYARQVGAVVGDITPELQLDPSDIQSYGVSTVTELLNELDSTPTVASASASSIRSSASFSSRPFEGSTR